MKKRLILTLVFISFIYSVHASSVGISPSMHKHFFEPNLQKTHTFYASIAGQENILELYVRGDLSEYVNISKSKINGSGYFDVVIKLPRHIEVPGSHYIYVGALDVSNLEEGTIGGRAGVEATIEIFVPYPGVYIESDFRVNNINIGENAEYEITLKNLGTRNVVIKPEINIYEGSESKKIYSKELAGFILESKKDVTLKDFLQTSEISPGQYTIVASIEYENRTDKIRKEFRVGQFMVEILDYSYMFEKGKISPFILDVESKWNSHINTIYAEIAITDEGKTLELIKTSFTDLRPWERKNITGYLDTANLNPKRYIASINLFYEGMERNKLVAVYVKEAQKQEITIFVVLSAALLFALVAIIFLIFKINKLKHE
jgi:hypothetical protein